MLNSLLQQATDGATKDEILKSIRDEMIAAIVSKRLPKRQDLIIAEISRLERLDRAAMVVELPNFVEWLNGRRKLTEMPAQTARTNAWEIAAKLPYRVYEIHSIILGTISLHPVHEFNGKYQILTSAIRLLQERSPQHKVAIFAKVTKAVGYDVPCRIMWVSDEGMCSMAVPDGGYIVRPITEVVAL